MVYSIINCKNTMPMELDLHMLRRFAALVDLHQSVSDATVTMGMTQPGMSIALAKLRNVLGAARTSRAVH